MIWAWLAHPSPEWFCRLLLKAAAPKTTLLSAAFLRAASRGECSAPWHDLLAAMEDRRERRVAAAIRNVVSRGHTSGADALAGFVWMADPGDRAPAQGAFTA
jgi:hypothetical protein